MGTQVELAGAAHSESKEVAAVTAPSPCNPPASDKVIDGLAALIITPSSCVGWMGAVEAVESPPLELGSVSVVGTNAPSAIMHHAVVEDSADVSTPPPSALEDIHAAAAATPLDAVTRVACSLAGVNEASQPPSGFVYAQAQSKHESSEVGSLGLPSLDAGTPILEAQDGIAASAVTGGFFFFIFFKN